MPDLFMMNWHLGFQSYVLFWWQSGGSADMIFAEDSASSVSYSTDKGKKNAEVCSCLSV